jgi:predicted transcriptional regulator
VRLSDDVLRRLGDLAGQRGVSVSSTIERLLDEALRREAHPGVTFRDGHGGRRAGLVAGPDVDEVVRTLRAVQEEGTADVLATVAEMTSLTELQVSTAIAYYADHRDEIDARIVAHERAAEDAEAAWRRQQEILAGPGR